MGNYRRGDAIDRLDGKLVAIGDAPVSTLMTELEQHRIGCIACRRSSPGYCAVGFAILGRVAGMRADNKQKEFWPAPASVPEFPLKKGKYRGP